MYEFDQDAQDVYEEIVEKYNAQFNLKWSCKYERYAQIIIKELSCAVLLISFQLIPPYFFCI